MTRSVGPDAAGPRDNWSCPRAAGGTWLIRKRRRRRLAGLRDKKPCGYTAHLTRRGWAWEFLRRNPAFRHDLANALEGGCRAETSDIARHHCLARRRDSHWGVLFRGLYPA
ncbi:transcriptional regulator domain-containing protein [Mesorhizobium album]|uniref:transcriptional regulator domain-containing protein n=1 Tax=Mesorhizobium album TaxID=3072314 RepID=UPI003D31B8A3